MNIQLISSSLAIPHSSELDNALPGYRLEYVRHGVDFDELNGRSFTVDDEITYLMPEGQSFWERNSFWRAHHLTDPSLSFCFVTFDGGNGWESLEAADKPEVMAAALKPEHCAPWSIAS